mgnify:CR=1 FL=1
MAETTFSSILNRPSKEAKRPPPLPTGTYVWIIKGMPESGKSSKKQTPFWKFIVVPQQSLDDVDEDQLKECGGLADKSGELTFYDTEKAGYRLIEFMRDDLGIDDDNGEKLGLAMIDETPNKQFLGHVKHTPSADGKGIRWEIDQTAPLES